MPASVIAAYVDYQSSVAQLGVEQMALLMHPRVIADLHERIWLLPDSELAPWWRVAMRQYNIMAGRPMTLLKP